MKNLLKTLLIIFFVIWLKNNAIIFCDNYDMKSNVTIAYQKRIIIAIISNFDIKDITTTKNE
jgi:hypothetical protein